MEPIAYKIRRSRRKTMSLNIERDGSVLVRAPLGTQERTIEEFVSRHRDWLQKKLLEFRPAALDLSDGAELVLFGAPYTIKSGRTRIADDTVFLPQEGRKEALIRLLKRFTGEVMEMYTRQLARRLGFCVQGVSVNSARGRWGSCSREGVIHYSFRIAFLPTALVEYIAVHELCHTVCFDHSPAFWAQVESCLPDWKERRSALKAKSSLMNLL